MKQTLKQIAIGMAKTASLPRALKQTRLLAWLVLGLCMTLGLAGAGRAQTQNFDGVTAPALPAGGAYYNDLVTSTSGATSAPNSLAETTVDANALHWFFPSATQDTFSGNVTVSATANFVGTTSNIALIARSSSLGVGGNAYAFQISVDNTYNNAGASLQKFVNGTQSRIGSVVGATALKQGGVYRISMTVSGSSLNGYCQRVSDGLWLSGSGTWAAGKAACCTATDTSVTGAGYAGGYFYAPYSSSVPLYVDDFSTATATAAAPQILVASPAVVPAAVPTLTETASGGTGTLNYQWYRSTAPGFAAGSGTLLANGSGITGATTATLTDGSTLTAGTTYYYRCVVTDSASPAVSASSSQRLIVATAQSLLKIIAIGDSQSVSQLECNNAPPLLTAGNVLSAKSGRAVKAVNAAVAGSSTAEWVAGSTDLNNAVAAAGGSLSGDWVLYRIGVNDAQGARTSTNVRANIVSTLSALQSQGVAGVLLSYSIPREPGLYGENGTTVFDESTTPLLLQYQAQMASLVTGNVYLGDTQSYAYFGTYPQTLYYYGTSPYSTTGPQGAIHENQIGASVMGANEANALLSILYPPGLPKRRLQ